MSATLTTDRGWTLTARGRIDEPEHELEGSDRLAANLVLVTNLWAYACQEKASRRSRGAARAEYSKQAELHRRLACEIADLVDKQTDEKTRGWCSACFEMHSHRKVEAAFAVPTYLCRGCGAATLRCVAPRCKAMATRGFGSIRIPRYCAEHRHAIPSFEMAQAKIDDLSRFQELLQYDKTNLSRLSKLGISGVLVAGAMTGVGLVAAPLVGGAVGTLAGGYTGAAATSYGLALIGGGSIASGGLGMAGGTAIIAAAGTALGGALGYGVTNAYISQDESFRIDTLQQGTGGPTVIVCSGFLTEDKSGWGDWERIITHRYPDSTVYRVHWGAQELAALGRVLGVGAGKAQLGLAIKGAALKASKTAAKKVSPLTGALIMLDLVKNPWHTARTRANKTGVVVADLVARTELEEVVLVGHSLGARAMVAAAETLGTKASAPKVRDVHLLGLANNAKHDWSALAKAVRGKAYNYHSRNDKVLKFLYATVEGGQAAAGLTGMKSALPGLVNVDVSTKVSSHSRYCKDLNLR